MIMPANDTITNNLGGWAIGQHLFNWLLQNVPRDKKILELGSGTGTIELSKHWNVASIEHDEKWLHKSGSQYIYAPLANGWYDVSKLAQLPQHDVIIVDGPPNTQGNRMGFYDNLHLFNKDALIVFDDINRKGDRAVMIAVSQALGRPFVEIGDDEKSFGVIGFGQKIAKEYLFLGCPRSGTGWCSRLMTINGIDVGHEKMGLHGISSWMFLVDDSSAPFLRDRTTVGMFQFKKTIQVVRNPLKVISSMLTIKKSSWDFMNKHTRFGNGNVIENAIFNYHEWNRMIAEQRPYRVFAIENPTTFIKEMEKVHNKGTLLLPQPTINARKHIELSQADVLSQIGGRYRKMLMDSIAAHADLCR